MNKIVKSVGILFVALSLVNPAYAADTRARQRVQIHDGTDEFAVTATKPIFSRLSDGTDTATINGSGQLDVAVGNTVTVQATNLDIRDLTKGTGTGEDNVLIFANTVKDGTGTDLVPLVDSDGHLQVDILTGSGTTQYAEDSAHVSADLGNVALVVRKDSIGTNTSADGDYATLLQDANGRLYTQIHDGGNVISVDDGAGSITVDNTTLSVVGGGTEATALRVTIANDSTGVLSVDDNGGSITVDGTVSVTATQLDIDDLNLTDDAVRVSGNTTANGETNPIFVKLADTVVSAEEVHDYDTSAAVAKDATDNHDYTVAGTTFFLKKIIVAASGAMRVEVKTGPVAALVTKAMIFTSPSKPTEEITFDPPIEVPATSTGTVRLIRRNDDNSAMDVYSTIIGNDV
jgi:hypothetical protein